MTITVMYQNDRNQVRLLSHILYIGRICSEKELDIFIVSVQTLWS